MWNFKNFGDRIAVLGDHQAQYTYRQLDQAQERLADAAGKRCLVFCLCENAPGSLLGYVAFVNNRIVPLLLDANLDHTLLEQLMQTYRPKYLWAPTRLVPQLRSSMTSGGKEPAVAYSDMDFSLLCTGYEDGFPLHDDLALLLTTSGSTGSPKLVRQSYANIKANTESIVEYLQITEAERPITTLPMSYTYGLSIINSHLYVGASLIMTMTSLMERAFWQCFKEKQATSFGGVPYIYEMLEKLRFFRMELPSLRTMTQAGGKLSPELHNKYAEFAHRTGRKFFVMYGQTEATARMAYLPFEKSIEKKGSMGIAIPGGKFSLIDIDGRTIEDADVTGELVYEGANVTLGYAQSGADLANGDERRGKLETGDMAKRDDEGYYYIVGRKKRFLKIFGSRVNLDETERLIKGAFEQLDCACAGIDDRMTVYVTDETLCDAVQKFLTMKMGLHHSAFHVAAIDKIPRNDAGKILYSELT